MGFNTLGLLPTRPYLPLPLPPPSATCRTMLSPRFSPKALTCRLPELRPKSEWAESGRMDMASSSLSLPTSLPTHFSRIPTLSIPLLSLPKPRAFSPNSIRVSSRSRSFVAAAMASNMTIKKVFDSEEDLAVSLAEYTADLSHKFVEARRCFTVVLSGGSLIKSLRNLVAPPYIDSVDWSKWHVFWVDERVVPKDHDDSNYKLAFDGFLSKVPILPGNVYAINDALSAEGAAGDYETCLRHLVKNGVIDTSVQTGFPKFDLMLLGMGPDGHVASLFPGHPLLEEDEKWVTFIEDSPKPPPKRITFTFPVINSSAYIAMVVAGAGKAGVVKHALENDQNLETLPVQRVSPEGELAWFLDKDAASKL